MELVPGLTLKDAVAFLGDVIEQSSNILTPLWDNIHNDYQVSRDTLNEIRPRWESGKATPNDLRVLLRAAGKDYDYLTADDDDDSFDMNDFRNTVNDYYSFLDSLTPKEASNGQQPDRTV